MFTTVLESHFAGAPRLELEEAWAHLLKGINVRVTLDDLQQQNQTSIKLPHDGDYLVWVEVFHQLHCVVGMTASLGN